MAKIITDKYKINEILTRGVEEVINRQHLEAALKSGKKLRIKLGVDPTGPKMHIGRAIQLWKLKAFQELGHQIVLIIGDFTAQIGDASDKTAMRKALTQKEVKENMRNYQKQIGMILNAKDVEFRYNSEWLSKLTLKNILSLSMHFTAQQLIQRRNFKERWEGGNPIGLHELYYPLLQGYDSVAVKADVEIGGFDQLFNLKTGREIQRIFKQEPQDIMTSKMLSGLDGRKMSTSWGNVITILDGPKDMFGKIMSIKDELMGEYFELCTRAPLKEIEEIKTQILRNPRNTKATLAKEIVKLYYGEKAALLAEQEFNNVFSNKGLPSEIPFFKALKNIYPILDLLKDAGLAPSKNEAKRIIIGKGVRINNIQKTDCKEEIKLEDGMIIQVGKRKFVRIKR